MTFGGHIVYLWPEQYHLRPSGARVQMMLRCTNYIPDKRHVIIVIINTQGQIVQIYFIKKDFLTRNHVAGCKFRLQPALCSLSHEKECFREGSLSFGRVQLSIVSLFQFGFKSSISARISEKEIINRNLILDQKRFLKT